MKKIRSLIRKMKISLLCTLSHPKQMLKDITKSPGKDRAGQEFIPGFSLIPVMKTMNISKYARTPGI